MTTLNLYFFGPPRIELDNHPLEVDLRKGLALLAYLAVTNQAHSRDALSTLFWPDADQSRGRSYLRHALWALKKTLGDDWLEISREQVMLNPEADIWLDVAAFQQGVGVNAGDNNEALSGLAEAVPLYRDDFLSGFTLPDAPDFDEWQFFQMEELRQQLAGALKRLVWGYSDRGDYEAAIPHARRWVALDPLHEPAQRHLMQLYGQVGQKAAALRQYDEYAALLDKELGLPPEEETQTLIEAIKAQRIVEPFLKAAMQPPEPVSERAAPIKPLQFPEETFPAGPVALPFVARQAELERLDTFLEAALAGQHRVAFILGDAGQGKTTLLQAFARHAQQSHPDLVVAGGNCNAYTGLGDPYLPFREILELLSGDIEAQAVSGTLSRSQARRLWHMVPATVQVLLEQGPDLLDTFVPAQALLNRATASTAENPPWLSHLRTAVTQRATLATPIDAQQNALFEQYARVIHTLATQMPLLLLLDDLQWADPGSISLLFHLGRRLTGRRVLMLGAYRPHEVRQGQAGEAHPLVQMVHEFQRMFGDITLDLSQAEGQAFVNALLDSEPNRLGPFFRETLYRQTGGHPLFTIELLRGMQERGDLFQDETGVWEMQASLNWNRLPARAEGAIGERISRLTPSLRELLQVASVEGEEFTADVVAQVLNLDVREVVRCLSGELDKTHTLVQAIGIRRIGHRRLSRYRFRHILIQRYLYNLLDEVERVYQHETVGHTLESIYDEQTAEVAVQLARHFEVAELPQKAVGYLLQAGKRASRLSAYAEAMTHFTQALALLEGVTDQAAGVRQELEVRIALGPVLMIVGGQSSPQVEENYIRAQALCQQIDEPSFIFPALWGLWRFHLNRPNLQTSHELGEQLLTLAQTIPDSELLVEAHMALGTTLFFQGEFAPARKHLEQAQTLYDTQQHDVLAFRFGGYDPAVYCLSYAPAYLWLLGDPERAFQQSQAVLDLARGLAHPYSLAFALWNTAMFQQFRGDAPTTQTVAEACIHVCQTHGFPFYLALATVMRGWALVHQGEVAEGIAQIQAGLNAHQATGAALVKPYFLALLAEVYGLVGQFDEGVTVLTDALAIAERTGECYWEAELYRLKGALLLQRDAARQSAKTEAEGYFLKAIEVARRQEAKPLALRASQSLAQIRQ